MNFFFVFKPKTADEMRISDWSSDVCSSDHRMPYRPAGTSAQAMTRKRRRLYLVGLALLSLGTATALMLTAFEDNLVFFFTPTELVAKEIAPGQRVRLGGLDRKSTRLNSSH